MVRRLYGLLTLDDDSWKSLVAPDFVIDFSRRLVDPWVARGSNDPLDSLVTESGVAVEFVYFGEDRTTALEAAGLPV